jgi:hypothetical protein
MLTNSLPSASSSPGRPEQASARDHGNPATPSPALSDARGLSQRVRILHKDFEFLPVLRAVGWIIPGTLRAWMQRQVVEAHFALGRYAGRS